MNKSMNELINVKISKMSCEKKVNVNHKGKEKIGKQKRKMEILYIVLNIKIG